MFSYFLKKTVFFNTSLFFKLFISKSIINQTTTSIKYPFLQLQKLFFFKNNYIKSITNKNNYCTTNTSVTKYVHRCFDSLIE
jgi:hypothetical protein